MCPESVDSSGSNQEKETAVTNSFKGKVAIITQLSLDALRRRARGLS